MKILAGLVIVVVLLMVLGLVTSANHVQDQPPVQRIDRSLRAKAAQPAAQTVAAPPRHKLDKSAEMQEKRFQAIEELVRKGIIHSYRLSGHSAECVVTPKFMALDYEAKKTFVDVVYSYFWDGQDEYFTLELLDVANHKAVGRADRILGFRME